MLKRTLALCNVQLMISLVFGLKISKLSKNQSRLSSKKSNILFDFISSKFIFTGKNKAIEMNFKRLKSLTSKGRIKSQKSLKLVSTPIKSIPSQTINNSLMHYNTLSKNVKVVKRDTNPLKSSKVAERRRIDISNMTKGNISMVHYPKFSQNIKPTQVYNREICYSQLVKQSKEILQKGYSQIHDKNSTIKKNQSVLEFRSQTVKKSNIRKELDYQSLSNQNSRNATMTNLRQYCESRRLK